MRMAVSSPEDTILMKLSWAKMMGGNEKHFTDAVRVYEVQYEQPDLKYLEEWTIKLGVEKEMDRLLTEAGTD